MKLKKKVEQCAKGCAMAVDNKYDYSQNNPDYAEVNLLEILKRKLFVI